MSQLPDGYAALEPYVADWAIASTSRRAERRGTSTPAERQAFFDAVSPLAAQALAELDRKTLAQLDDREQRLLYLMLSFAHVSQAVEVQGEAEAEHARWRAHMKITRAPADLPV